MTRGEREHPQKEKYFLNLLHEEKDFKYDVVIMRKPVWDSKGE